MPRQTGENSAAEKEKIGRRSKRKEREMEARGRWKDIYIYIYIYIYIINRVKCGRYPLGRSEF